MIELTLPAMSCNHCVRAITEAVHRVDPQAALAFDLPQHRVSIDSVAALPEITAALADEGYPAG